MQCSFHLSFHLVHKGSSILTRPFTKDIFVPMNTQIILKRSKNNRIRNGHPWIYGNEIEEVKNRNDDGEKNAGEIVEVKENNGKFLGCGYYNPQSQIAVRLLTRTQG